MKYLFLLFITASLFGESIPRMPKMWDEWNYNQKIAWRGKHPDPRIPYSLLADKLLVKEFMKEYANVAKLLYATDDPNTISTVNLPPSYVMKANNACNRGLLVKNGFLLAREKGDSDFAATPVNDELLRSYSTKWLQKPYNKTTEKQYLLIKPMILFEEYLESLFMDVQLFSFYGKVTVIKIIFREKYQIPPSMTFYDRNWNLIHSTIPGVNIINTVGKKPKDLEEMIALAEKLSSNIDHVRVDFSIAGDTVYFSEFTFTTGTNWVPESLQTILSKDWVYPAEGLLH